MRRGIGHSAGICSAVLGLAGALAGCEAPGTAPGLRVDQAWQSARRDVTVSETAPAPGPPGAIEASQDDDCIAVADGHPISRQRFFDLLVRGHGAEILEQLIVLAAAEGEAAAQGLTVTDADVQAEYDLALQRMASPVQSAEPEVFDRKAGEAMLADVLARRNVSREEYLLAVRRNACLRKIANVALRLTDEELREEFSRSYGQRVQVRHIQVADLREAQKVRRDLDAGAEFVSLVRRYSANPNTVLTDGLLRPFSAEDPDVPALLRDVAFALKDGQVSSAVQVGNWYHILRRERTYPASRVEMEQVRADLETRLRSRRVEPAVQELYRALLQRADITVYEPALREALAQRQAAVTTTQLARPDGGN